MAIASELVQLTPSLFLWQTYDPAVKADLFSAAVATPNGTFLVDPIPLAEAALAQLLGAGPLGGVIVTNGNHWRAALDFADRSSVPIFVHPEVFPAPVLRCMKVTDGDKIGDELVVIGIEGAVAGEIALHYRPAGGTLIIGDALINFEPYGFTFLPRKYCSNEKQMRRSLRKLLAYKAERILFAHGTPILSGASARLQELLGADF